MTFLGGERPAHFTNTSQATGRTLVLYGVREQSAKVIHQAEFEEVIGQANICENVQHALRRAEEVFEKLEVTGAVGTK